MTNERYEIKYGKFGAYFYDKNRALDMTLKHVLRLLNNPEGTDKVFRLKTIPDKVKQLLTLLKEFNGG